MNDHKFKLSGFAAACLCLFAALIQTNLDVPCEPKPPLQIGSEEPATKFQLSVNFFGRKLEYGRDNQKTPDPNELEQYRDALSQYREEFAAYEAEMADYYRKRNYCRVLLWSSGLVAFLFVIFAWAREEMGWLTTGVFLLTVFGLILNLLLSTLGSGLFLFWVIVFLFLGGGEMLIWGVYLLVRLSFKD